MDIKKDNEMYMTIAQIAAQRSYAKRLKVGCVIVKPLNYFFQAGTDATGLQITAVKMS